MRRIKTGKRRLVLNRNMPRTKPVKRVNVSLPDPMIDEIDRLCLSVPEYHFNRQSFIENGVRRFMGLMQAREQRKHERLQKPRRTR